MTTTSGGFLFQSGWGFRGRFAFLLSRTANYFDPMYQRHAPSSCVSACLQGWQ
jgi:hypothetical protein